MHHLNSVAASRIQRRAQKLFDVLPRHRGRIWDAHSGANGGVRHRQRLLLPSIFRSENVRSSIIPSFFPPGCNSSLRPCAFDTFGGFIPTAILLGS